MQVVQVAGRILIDDDDIGAEAFQAPVFLRLQHLPHERDLVVAGDTHQKDRQVARDAERPQVGLPELVRRDQLRACAQRFICEQHS